MVALAVYGALATPHIVDGDNAEYSTLGTIGGAAHPTGYPLYLLWLRAMAWLPGTPAHAAWISAGANGWAGTITSCPGPNRPGRPG